MSPAMNTNSGRSDPQIVNFISVSAVVSGITQFYKMWYTIKGTDL
jgi:hypothetical protein